MFVSFKKKKKKAKRVEHMTLTYIKMTQTQFD